MLLLLAADKSPFPRHIDQGILCVLQCESSSPEGSLLCHELLFNGSAGRGFGCNSNEHVACGWLSCTGRDLLSMIELLLSEAAPFKPCRAGLGI